MELVAGRGTRRSLDAATRYGCATVAHADIRGLGTFKTNVRRRAAFGLGAEIAQCALPCAGLTNNVAEDSLDGRGCVAFPIRPLISVWRASPPGAILNMRDLLKSSRAVA